MNKAAPEKLGRRVVKWMAIFMGGFLLLGFLMPFYAIPLEFTGLMLFGWIGYLGRVFPQITFNREIAFEATAALILAVFGLHRILGWWTEHGREGASRWRFGWTLRITTMVLLLFATSIAAVGMVHQIAWLCREPKLIEMRGMGKQTRELSNVKQVAVALKLYSLDHEGKFPKQLEELSPDYLPDHDLFFTRALDGDPPQRIIYYVGYNANSDEAAIVLASPRLFEAPRGLTRVVAHIDTSAVVILESQFQQLMQEQRKPASK